MEITEGLWIVPEWRNPPVRLHKLQVVLLFSSLMDTRVCIGLWLQDVEATNIFLNPGLAFGTGEHPTTKLCLLFLHRLIKGGEHFLDYGTGSGVLAIAALKVLHLKKKNYHNDN